MYTSKRTLRKNQFDRIYMISKKYYERKMKINIIRESQINWPNRLYYINKSLVKGIIDVYLIMKIR